MIERTIEGSAWRDRRNFDAQLEPAVVEALKGDLEGVVFRWDHVNIFGEKVSLVLENKPGDELIGRHAELLLTKGDESEPIEINTQGADIYSKYGIISANDLAVIDVGDLDQVPDFIGVCARALEVGIHPDVIAYSAMDMVVRSEKVIDRRDAFEKKRMDFSRQLSERQFI